MNEIKDIVDRESLEAWLTVRPQKISQVIIHKSAMRVLPDYWHWALSSKRAEKDGATVTSILRANLIAEVVAYSMPSDISEEMSQMASESASEAITVGKVVNAQMDMFSGDDFFALDDVFFTNERKAAVAAFAANSALVVTPPMARRAADSGLIYNGAWGLIRSDCSDLMVRFTRNRSALWQGEINPFLERWANIKLLLTTDDVDWSFWIKWYEAALNGEPLSSDMLELIALIPSEDWEQGPKHVNGLIAGIEAEFEVGSNVKSHADSENLVRNARVISAQLDTLLVLLEEEARLIRSPNALSAPERERVEARVAVMNEIGLSVNRMKEALEIAGPTVLVIIEENLPEVLVGAEKLAQGEDDPELSVLIVQIGAIVEHLVSKKVPGAMATPIAMGEVVRQSILSWWTNIRKPKP